jgi:hypothetical protein
MTFCLFFLMEIVFTYTVKMFLLLTCCSTIHFLKLMSSVVCVICMCVIVIYFNKNSSFELNLRSRFLFW